MTLLRLLASGFRACVYIPKNFEYTYSNRNPRNLELMGIAQQTSGWEFQAPRKNFWHKCILDRGSQHTVGKVVHHSSSIVITASTEETAISKHLYSNTDVSAAENIGLVLAHRCMCLGIISLFFDTVETPLNSLRNKAFYDALIMGGLTLEEVSFPRKIEYGIDYDTLTDEKKRALYPSLIEELRSTPDWGQERYPYSLRPVSGLRRLKLANQVLSKVREGYTWDTFYARLVKPEDMAAWQVEQKKIHEDSLGRSSTEKFKQSQAPADVYIPERWKFN